MPKSISHQGKNIPTDIFSRRLVAAIEAAGLTQQELSAKAGCSQPDISRYLKGRVPSGEKLVALARALGTTAEVLLGFDPMPSAEPAADWRKEAEAAKLKVDLLKKGLETLLRKADR